MKRSTSTSQRIIWALLGLVGAFLLLWGGSALTSREASQRRGTTYGPPPPMEHLHSPWGVNTALEQYDEASMDRALERIAAGGFYWVRQTFPWARIEPAPGEFDWRQWDRIVSAVDAHGLELIAVLDTTPPWAREGLNPHTPPFQEADFGRFARTLAARYGDQICCYQIWDEPNLSAHWGDRYVDPAAYARMLQAAAFQIRSADPQALILTAGLAPTWEQGPLNMDETAFLQGLYEAGAGEYFDVVAAKPYGFWSGPEDRRVSSQVLNFSRLIRLREIMMAHGDGARPIWAVEWGWAALPPEWRGSPSPWGTDEEEKQIRRLQGAIERARLEWPWLGAMLWATYQPAVPPDDARWGFALVNQDGHPRPFYDALQRVATAPPIAYPGRYPADHPTGDYEGSWRLASGKADIGRSGDRLTIPFRGTELALVVWRGGYWAWLEVSVDGGPANALPQDEMGRSYIVLYDPRGREVTVPVARGLEDGIHQVSIVAHGGWGQWTLQGWVVSRDAPGWLGRVGVALSVAGAALALGAVWQVARLWPGWWMEGWTDPEKAAPLCLPFALFSGVWFLLPWGREVMYASTAVFALVAARQPLWALGTLLFTLPFYMSSHPLPGLPLASLDLLGAAATVGMIGRWLWQRQGGRAKSRLADDGLGPCGRSLSVLTGLGLISTLAADERALAWAAFWRIMALPGLVYLLARSAPRGQHEFWGVVHAWLVGGVAVAGIGIYQFTVGQAVAVEGVQRVTGPYASPNHLALFLEWLVPLLVSALLSGHREHECTAKDENCAPHASSALLSGARCSKSRRGSGACPALLVRQLPLAGRAASCATPFGDSRNSRKHLRPKWHPAPRWMYALALGPTLAALYLTYSRATWLLALPASLLFLTLVIPGRWRRWLWAGVLLALGSVIPWRGTERLSTLFALGHGDGALRPQVWRATLDMVLAHPLLGVGPGNFHMAYPRYMRPTAWTEPLLYHSHNVFLDFAAFLGLGGLVLFVVLLVALFRSGWRLLHPPAAEDKGHLERWHLRGEERVLLMGLMAAAVGSLAHGLVDHGYFLPDLACLWALTLGLVDRFAAPATGPSGPLDGS